MNTIRIGIVGDHDETITAHRALPVALQRVAAELGRPVEGTWLATDTIASEERLAGFDALWCAPGSPYRSMDGALRAIRHAREQGVPRRAARTAAWTARCARSAMRASRVCLSSAPAAASSTR